MIASKWKMFAVAAIALLALYQIVAGFTSGVEFHGENFGCDLRVRRNEVLCAHQGVNAFRIWNREISVPGFVPSNRPPKETVHCEVAESKRVQGYSPWHVAFFWFYGWLSEFLCVSLMSVVFALCCCHVVRASLALVKDRFPAFPFAAWFALAMISAPATGCYLVLNYGVLILAAFFLMNRALERKHDILAGLAWAVMMVKPQVGLMFVWPLFWHRRYLTIATAAALCLAGAIFTSFAVHESVIDLILQIPEFGRAYGSGAVMNKFVRPFFGDGAMFFVSAFFFALVGVLTWMLRKDSDFLASCVPVALIIPLWTYSNGGDPVILLPAYLMLTGRIWAERRWDALTVLGGLFLLLTLFMSAWGIPVGLGVFDPTGLGWIYRIAEYSSYAIMLAIAALFVRDSRRAAATCLHNRNERRNVR